TRFGTWRPTCFTSPTSAATGEFHRQARLLLPPKRRGSRQRRQTSDLPIRQPPRKGNDPTREVSMDLEAKQHELEVLRARVRRIEDDLASATSEHNWPPRGYYAAYYATTGFMLGIFGAATSLLVNVIAAPIAGKNPLELIRIYLTFPLGEQAL